MVPDINTLCQCSQVLVQTFLSLCVKNHYTVCHNTIYFIEHSYVYVLTFLCDLQLKNLLLVMQGKNFNAQIPGKVYDYLRARRPILGLVDKGGATADLLRGIKHACVSDIDQVEDIICCLRRVKEATVDANFSYEQYSRRGRTQRLAMYFNSLL